MTRIFFFTSEFQTEKKYTFISYGDKKIVKYDNEQHSADI